MTDTSNHLHAPDPLRCDEAMALLSDYVDGRLGEEAAWRLEYHAGHCTACAERLSRLTPTLPTREVVMAHLAPNADELAAMRANVLRPEALPTRRPGERSKAAAQVHAPVHPRIASFLRLSPWTVGVGLAAAASLFAVMRSTPSDGSDTVPDVAQVAPALDPDSPAPMETAVQLAAMQLAAAQAAPEFAALDAATSELEAALANTPDDPELRSFRSALDARRDELTQRIRSVTE